MAIIEAITTTYLEADTGEVVFASIPSTYEHLQLWICDRSARSSGDALQIQFGTGGGSPDSGTNYSYHNMNGTGSSAAGAATTGATFIQVGDTPSQDSDSSVYGGKVIDILDYANTNKNTSVSNLIDTGAARVYFSSGLWDATGAVDRIRLFNYSANFMRGSEFTLYGLNSS